MDLHGQGVFGQGEGITHCHGAVMRDPFCHLGELTVSSDFSVTRTPGDDFNYQLPLKSPQLFIRILLIWRVHSPPPTPPEKQLVCCAVGIRYSY